jgi:uncharacterized protein YdiU (UPF0061 family)
MDIGLFLWLDENGAPSTVNDHDDHDFLLHYSRLCFIYLWELNLLDYDLLVILRTQPANCSEY